MEAQLKLNLTRQVHAEDGNSMVPYSFRGPGALQPLFELVVKRMGKKDRGTLIIEYVIEGLMRDVGTITLADLQGNVQLKDMLPKA